MNFQHIPFYSDYHGFVATVGSHAAVIAVVMLAFFRVKRWI